MARKDDFPIRVLGMTLAVVVFVAMAGLALAVVAHQRAPREAILGQASTTTAALELALPGPGAHSTPADNSSGGATKPGPR